MKKLKIEAKGLNTNDLIEVLAEIIKDIIRGHRDGGNSWKYGTGYYFSIIDEIKEKGGES